MRGLIFVLAQWLCAAAAAAPPTRGWPPLTVPPEGIELYRALSNRMLTGRDAASVFLALVRPGQYEVLGAFRRFELNLDFEVNDRHVVDLLVQMSLSGLQLGRRFLVFTGDVAPVPDEYARLELKSLRTAEGWPTLRLSLTPPGREASVIRVKFAQNLRRLVSVTFAGPTLDRFRDLAPEHLTGPTFTFTFANRRPSLGLELDCLKLLRRLESTNQE